MSQGLAAGDKILVSIFQMTLSIFKSKALTSTYTQYPFFLLFLHGPNALRFYVSSYFQSMSVMELISMG